MAVRKAKSAGPPDAGALLRSIPKVDKLLDLDEFGALIASHSRPLVVRQVRAELAQLRQRAVDGALDSAEVEIRSIRERVTEALARQAIPYYRRVINATGIVLHTGLGRAPLAPEAVRALRERAGHPVRVEIDLESGERGGRDEGCAALLRELTGAEAATVVNNNAGATLLVLAALARGKKVVISRGELVEIGGSYRIPEIMKEGGALLVEVGTTNRTHPRDYREALDSDTGMILKVHTSNYRIEGFASEVEIEELVAMGAERGIPVVHDLGSGCLIALEAYGLAGEPHVLRSVAAGADLVTFSGDKLLGGPQAGIIIGKRSEVDRC
ncbi:MAG: L-seryl-tRNA(Sec) selenium transferase, partial [Planctomycetes bacterium]|nr:L-seryl-tRNA(Sec) selenium transferase [Planctomycetota bacterium]